MVIQTVPITLRSLISVDPRTSVTRPASQGNVLRAVQPNSPQFLSSLLLFRGADVLVASELFRPHRVRAYKPLQLQPLLSSSRRLQANAHFRPCVEPQNNILASIHSKLLVDLEAHMLIK